MSEPWNRAVTMMGMKVDETGEHKTQPGVWIAFEGVDGCGKSTQAGLLAERLGAVLTREPGNTDVGAAIRNVLLHQVVAMHDRCEVLLFAADRAEHIEKVVKPVLAAGGVVVSDRSVWSSAIYQGIGRGVGVEEVLAVNDWASDGVLPDIVVYLRRRETGTVANPDRIEAAGEEFYAKVEAGFETWAMAEDWIIVDAGGIEELAEKIAREVKARMW